MTEESDKVFLVINEVCNDLKLYDKTDTEKNNMILVLNNCNCCERHQVDKPKILEKYIETNFKGDDKSKYNCQCKCRQVARFICRSKYGLNNQ